MLRVSLTQRGAQFITELETGAYWACTLLHLYIASLANYLTEIGFGRRNGYDLGLTGGIDNQIVNFDEVASWNAIHVLIVLCDSLIYISKMWIGAEATRKPTRHSGRPHRRSKVIRDAPRPPWS